MNIQVRFFAAAREQIGTGQIEIELPSGARLQTLIDTLFQKYHQLSSMRLRFAVNAVYAEPDTPLHDGDQVACIPPVGGG